MGGGFSDLSMMMGKKPILSPSQENPNTLPTYWKNAVDTMASTIRKRQETAGYQTFQFIWFSDLHGVSDQKTNDTITSRVAHIGSIAQYAADKYDIPFVAISGDIMSQASHGSVSSVYTENKQIKKLLSPINRDKLLMVKGNHDGAWGSPVTIDGTTSYYPYNIGQRAIFNEIYRRQALEHERVFGGDGSYFYMDTPQKVRFVMLNSFTDGDSSADENGYAVYNPMKTYAGVYGTEQLTWLAETALDVPNGWSVVVMGHGSLYSTGSDAVILAGILNAYNNRTSYSKTVDISSVYPVWGNGVSGETYKKTTVNVDFTNAEGVVVGYFHGHLHIDMIQDMDTTGYTFPCLCITTAGADVRDINLNYPRVVGTATETALDIVTVDMLNKVIYCDRLGAGEATRLVSYGIGSEPIVTYTVTNNLTNCTNSNSASTVTEGASYSATITAKSSYVLGNVTVTMGGKPVTVTNGVINIANVTGNIIITATAVESANEPDTPSYTNLADPSATGWVHNSRMSSSSGAAKAEGSLVGSEVTNYIQVNANDTLYVKGIDMTVAQSDSTFAMIATYTDMDEGTKQSILEVSNGTHLTATKNGDVCSISLGGKVKDGWYIRVNGTLMDGYTADDVVITINEIL